LNGGASKEPFLGASSKPVASKMPVGGPIGSIGMKRLSNKWGEFENDQSGLWIERLGPRFESIDSCYR
jgi:hypothetical protein